MNPADSILDALLRHDTGISRLSNGTVRRIIALLNDSVPDLERQIRERVGWIAARGYDASPHTLKRLEANLASVRQVLRESYKAAFTEVRGDLLKLADYEGEYIGRMLGREAGKIGVELGGGAPTSQLLKSIVDTRPFQGRLLRDWAKELPENAYRGVRQAIRQGLTQSESIDQIVRRIKGTRANGYADGILDRSRRELETVVRTATSHVTNHARDETYRQNSDLIKGVKWVATLDSRTCRICAVRDGLLYDLDHKPIGHSIPWGAGPGRMHRNDRCTSSPTLKTFKEMGLDLPEIQLPGRRVRGEGIVPSNTTYSDWLKRQPAGVQNNILGVNRARDFRAGRTSFDSFHDNRGRWLNLDQLKGEEAA